jgi:hypothetical protein
MPPQKGGNLMGLYLASKTSTSFSQLVSKNIYYVAIAFPLIGLYTSLYSWAIGYLCFLLLNPMGYRFPEPTPKYVMETTIKAVTLDIDGLREVVRKAMGVDPDEDMFKIGASHALAATVFGLAILYVLYSTKVLHTVLFPIGMLLGV